MSTSPSCANNDAIMQKSVDAYTNDSLQMQKDIKTYNDEMDHFAELAEQDPMIAMVYFLTTLCPQLLTVQEDNINMLADQMNISSAMRNYVTDIQNDFNEGQLATTDSMKDLTDQVNSLDSWTKKLSDTSATSDWVKNGIAAPLDATTAANIDSNMTAIKKAFGYTDANNLGDWGDPTKMTADMQKWFSIDTTNPNPSDSVRTVQGALQQTNSAVSTVSTTLQTQEEYLSNNYNQYVSFDNSAQASFFSGENAMIQNQKTA